MSGIDHRAETKDKKKWKTFFLKTKKGERSNISRYSCRIWNFTRKHLTGAQEHCFQLP